MVKNSKNRKLKTVDKIISSKFIFIQIFDKKNIFL